MNDGGPAFPCPVGHIQCKHPEGMSLPDWFAGMALQGLMANGDRYKHHVACQGADWDSYMQTCVQDAINIANAMLKARGS